MILKGSQRGGGRDLAVHLLRTDENEHVRVYEVRGFAEDDLRGAFKEAEAVSRGTKCRQYLFSLSLSPPEDASVSEAMFERTIDRIEERLGLSGQPRAIVFHEKEGRRHAHAVWSRIDAETMTARPLPFFKRKLMDVSRDLYLDHGWKMPRGLIDPAQRNPTNFTLAEWQQAKRLGVDPRWIKQAVQDCWAGSDNRSSFARSLEERGFTLAKGDRRDFVIVGHDGDVHSLPRALDLKTKEVRARLGDGEGLKSVSEVRQEIGARMTPAIRRHIQESRTRFRERSATLGHYKMEMTHLHRDARAKLDERQRSEWDAETRARAARLPKGLRGLWHRLTGKYQEVRAANEREAEDTKLRHREERQAQIEQQHTQRAVLQEKFKELRHRQAEQLSELRRDVSRYLRLSRGDPPDAARSRARAPSLDLKRGL